ncbi:MAG: glutaredoxin 3 [Alphaproteobacteria bacterium]|jgi:glutaredoxin 3
MADVEMYYRDFCGFSMRAERLLQSKNIDFRSINIWEVDGAKEEMIQRSGGRTTVPQIFVDGVHIGGSDELFALDAEGKLDALLAG